MVSEIRYAHISSNDSKRHPNWLYTCNYVWSETCWMQCGNGGIVFEKNIVDIMKDQQAEEVITAFVTPQESKLKSYRTAFFEVFAKEPDTFIRGEGKTVQEAEQKAWEEWQKVTHCPGENGHEFEAKGHENGAGVCKHCGLFAVNVIPSPHKCQVCKTSTWYTKDIENRYYCEKHKECIPEALWTEEKRWLMKLNDQTNNILPPLAEEEEKPDSTTMETTLPHPSDL